MANAEKRALPSKKSWWPLILILLITAGTAGFALWKFTAGSKDPAVSFAPPPQSSDYSADSAPASMGQKAQPEGSEDSKRGRDNFDSDPTYQWKDEGRSEAGEGAKEEDSPPNEATAGLNDRKADEQRECEAIAQQIKTFFKKLDAADYLQQRQSIPDAQEHLVKIADKLLSNPPVVSGETDSLFSVLSNTAHFYRLLSLNDLLLLKDILTNESRELEEIMEIFYRWSQLADQCPQSGVNIQLPLPSTYEYAGFFLNTLGGRSYLFRRESRVRMLFKYYSILILDDANEAKLNRHGLDIRPDIEALLSEMAGSSTLENRDEYLAILTELQDKYQQQYGKR
mgnify:CR=1 FL=1